MFQFGTDDDEQPDGLAASLSGAKPNSMTDFGLGATLSQVPNSGNVAPATGDTMNAGGDASGAADSDAPTDKPEAAPADDSGAGEWGKMPVQLYEAGKFKSGYLSKIFGSVNYANLAENSLNTSMQVGLDDIRTFEYSDGLHGNPQGSVINWRLVDWSKYGAEIGIPPATVMRNFLRAAMAN